MMILIKTALTEIALAYLCIALAGKMDQMYL